MSFPRRGEIYRDPAGYGERAMNQGYPPYSVHWSATLPYPIRDALRRWRGTVGMVVGVGIALGIGMTLLAVSQASVELYTADFRDSGADLYVIIRGGTLIGVLPGDTPGTIEDARHLLRQIRGLPEVGEAVGFISWSMVRQREGPRRRDEATELVMAVAVDGDATAIPGAVVLKEGRWLRRSDEVVLGSKVAREKALRIGDSLRLNGRDFTVVGVGKLRGAGFTADSVAYLEWQAFRQRVKVGDVVNVIIIDAAQPASVRQKVHQLGSFSISDPSDLVRQAEEVNATAVVFRWIIVSLTLTIAALFVSNMLLRSVAERRLEFATLRAIGIPTGTILLTVGVQALIISVAAGVVGVGVSLALGGLINGWVAPQYGIESPLYTPDAKVFFMVFLLAAGLGVVSGLLPARQATRVDPVIVLREA